MTTRAVYVIGGAGVGKSTFVGDLTSDSFFGPHVEIAVGQNSRGSRIAFRGHWLSDGGLYIGRMRDSFPGTDGLDRACGPTGAAWLRAGKDLPPYIISEGATLASETFLTALAETTDLLVIHLWVEDWIRELWCAARGSDQKPEFLKSTTTRSEKMASLCLEMGVVVETVDTADPDARRSALESARSFLRNH